MGSLISAMKKNAVVLQKPSATIATRVDLTAIQRKFYDALLYIAKQDLRQNKDKKTFIVSFEDLKTILNKEDKTKKDDYYIERLKELKLKNAEYDILNKDGDREWGMFSLVSDLAIKSKKGIVTNIYFEIPERVKNALLDPDGIYANINLIVIRGLRSKYAIVLYELTKDYEKVEIPEMTIEKFKKLFGIEGKYGGRIDNLRRKVLKPAIEELNNNPHIDFLVDYKLRKTGPKYTRIKFIVKPKPAQIKNKQKADQLVSDYAQEIAKENPELKELLALIPKDLRKRRKIVGIVMESLEKKGFEYTKAQIEYTLERYENKKIRNFESYLKKAVEEDYAGAEAIELGEFEILGYKDLIGEKIRDREGMIYKIKSFEEKDAGMPEELREKDKYIVHLESAEDGKIEVVVWSKDIMDKVLEYVKRKKGKNTLES